MVTYQKLILLACITILTSCARFTSEPLSPAKTAADFDSRRLSAKQARWSLTKLVAEATGEKSRSRRAARPRADGGGRAADGGRAAESRPIFQARLQQQHERHLAVDHRAGPRLHDRDRRQARCAHGRGRGEGARRAAGFGGGGVEGARRRAARAARHARGAGHARAVSLAGSRAGGVGAAARSCSSRKARHVRRMSPSRASR